MTLSHDIGLIIAIIIAIIIIITIITYISNNVFKPSTQRYSFFCSYNNKNDEQKNNKQTQRKKINITKETTKLKLEHTPVCVHIHISNLINILSE